MSLNPIIRICPVDRVQSVLRAYETHTLVSIVTMRELNNKLPCFDGNHIHIEMWDCECAPILLGGGGQIEDYTPSLDKIERMVKCFQSIPDEASVLFHCYFGKGRSPAAAMIYLMEKGMSHSDALSYVKKISPFARPNTLMLSLYFKLKGLSV